MRQSTSSNAKKYMVGAHDEHPFSVEAIQAKLGAVSNRIVAYDVGTSAEQQTEPKVKKQRTIVEAMAVNADEVRIFGYAVVTFVNRAVDHASTSIESAAAYCSC